MSVVKRITAAIGGAGKAAADVRSAVENLRSDRLRLLDERDAIEAMATPREEAVAALDAGLDQLANRAIDGMSISSLTRPARSPSFDPRVPEGDVFGLLIAAKREAVREIIIDRLDEFYSQHAAMSAIDKAARTAEIDAALFDLELAEEGAIRAAEAAGLAIERREDADPRAVLAADISLG